MTLSTLDIVWDSPTNMTGCQCQVPIFSNLPTKQLFLKVSF